MFVQYTSNDFATYVYKEPWLQGTNLVGSDIYVIWLSCNDDNGDDQGRGWAYARFSM